MILNIAITKAEDGKSVKWLLKNKLELSERLLKKLKNNSKILINKNPVYVNYIASEGDLLEAIIEFEEETDDIVPQNIPLDIIYEDSCLIAINKAPNMVVHPTAYHPDGTYANALAAHYKNNGESIKIRPVSRLDRDTSGVIVFAKNPYIQEKLIAQMKNDNYIKKYIGVVWGNIESEQGTIHLPIDRKPGSIMLRHISPDGAISITDYKVLKHFNDATMLEFRLRTGRTHQIRVHCQAIGHSLIGDGLYSDIETDKICRQALHSYYTSFIHPETGKVLELNAALPNDMEVLLKLLE